MRSRGALMNNNNHCLEDISMKDQHFSNADEELNVNHRRSPNETITSRYETLSIGTDGVTTTTPTAAMTTAHTTKELLFCLLFCVLCLLSYAFALPRRRPIPYQLLNTGEYVRNLVNNEPFNGDTVSSSMNIILAVVLPLLMQSTLSKVYGLPGDFHGTLCIYFVAFALTLMATGIVKNYVGYLRPSFYAVCEPDENYGACSVDDGNGESTRKSFPSGHASTAFCGLTLLTLYLHNRFGEPSIRVGATVSDADSRYNKDPLHCRVVSILSLAPMGLATFIAASRIADNRHFPADVVCGSLLGASIANFVHNLWF